MPSRRPSASSSPAHYAEFAAQPRAAGGAHGRDRHLRHLRRGRHLRQHRPAVSRSMWPSKLGLAVEPVSTQVIPRDRHAMFFATLGVDRLLDRAAGGRDPPPAAHRGAGGGGVFLAGPEGLVGDAAQAQPGADRKPDRPCRAWCAPRSLPALENVALWHERDISHSSVERVIGAGCHHRRWTSRWRGWPA